MQTVRSAKEEQEHRLEWYKVFLCGTVIEFPGYEEEARAGMQSIVVDISLRGRGWEGAIKIAAVIDRDRQVRQKSNVRRSLVKQVDDIAGNLTDSWN